KSYKLNIIFHKVQAHSDNTLNNLADSLAKQHTNKLSLHFNYTNIYNPYHLLFFEIEKFPVELLTRYFVKSICKAYNLALWSSQKRNDEWTPLAHHINWNSTWLYFNHNQKSTYNLTNFKFNQSKSFKIKTLLNELPTQYL